MVEEPDGPSMWTSLHVLGGPLGVCWVENNVINQCFRVLPWQQWGLRL